MNVEHKIFCNVKKRLQSWKILGITEIYDVEFTNS